MERIMRHDWTRAVLLALGAIVVWRLKFIFVILFVSFVLAVVLDPFVRRLHKIHLPAALAVLLPLSVLVGIISTLTFYVGPEVGRQLPRFIEDFPVYAEQLPLVNLADIDLHVAADTVLARFGNLDQIVVNVGAAIVKGVIGTLTIIVITIYWLGSYDETKKTLISYLPKRQRDRAHDIWARIEHKLGKWFVGQVLVSVAVGVLVWAAARILSLPYAGVLGLIAGLLEIIPNVGPVLAALPAVMIGATESFEKALIVTGTYILIQQFENHILTPQLMGRTVKLHPIIIIVAILSGGILLGIVGALFAVPASLVISSFVDSFRGEKQSTE